MFNKLLGLPINASAHGGEIDSLIGWVHLLMAVLFVGWILLFFWMLLRFRKSRHPRADHEGVKSHVSSYIEAIILVLEIILLVGISIPFWAKKVSAFPTPSEDPLRIRVIAQQFAWNIHYPGPDGKFGKTEIAKISSDNAIGLIRKGDGADDVIEVNQLYLPVNRPVILDTTTLDVIHSLFLPLFRVKQDTIPGMIIPIYFTPNQTTEEIRQKMRETVPTPRVVAVTTEAINDKNSNVVVGAATRVDADVLKKLADAGVAEEELAGKTRNVVIMADKRNAELYATAEDIKDNTGTILVKKGARLAVAAVKKLETAGITSVAIAPANPTEIACAQLCGLNHYRMKGYVNVLPAADFKKWYDEEVENQKE